VLRQHCKERTLQFTPPIEHDGVEMLRGDYYKESGLKHIRRARFNMFDADSESGPQIQLRMLQPAIEGAMVRGHAMVVRNNMTGAARGRLSGASWWSEDNIDERRHFVQEYKYLLSHSVNLTEPTHVNAAAFFIKVAQYTQERGGKAKLYSQGFYKPERVGRQTSTVMCPSIFGIKPR